MNHKGASRIATSYVANADTAVIGILGYFWPRGFDAPNSVGSRDLPTSVLDEHERIGLKQ